MSKTNNHKAICAALFAAAIAVLAFAAFVHPAVAHAAEEKLAAPKTVTVARVSDSSLRVKWSAVKGAAGYVVYAYEDGEYRTVKKMDASTRTLTIKKLKSSTTYRYKVCAYTEAEAGEAQMGARSVLVSARPYAKKAKKVNADSVSYDLSRIIVLKGRTIAVSAQAKTSKSGKSVINKRVWYSTSDPSIATVDANGVITGVKKGTCNLVCRTHNGRSFTKKIYVRKAFKTSYINFIAHRGAEYMAPENTLAAFEAAGTEGFAGFECDIWETNSGDIMISHAENLLEQCGVDISVKKVSISNREKYPIISGVNVANYATQYLPSISQTVSVAKSNGGKLYLHIKQKDMSTKALKKVYRTLEQRGMLKNTVVFSSSLDTAKRIAKKTKLTVGYLDLSTTDAKRISKLKSATKAGVDCVIYHYFKAEPLSYALVKKAHAAGLTIGAYGVSTKDSTTRMIDVGADFCLANKKLF